MAYPLFPVLALYVEWLLAWSVLDHIPVPGLDDPKYIDGATWMYPIVYLAILGLVPVIFIAIGTNLHYVVTRPMHWRRRGIRILSFLVLWLGMVVLIAWDPGRVIYWWLD